MNFNDAQKDMRYSYLSGATGVFVSGLVWLIAGAVAFFVSLQAGMIALFFGGMLIHPLGIMLDKMFGRSGNHKSGNPLGALALESTFLLFIGLFIAYAAAQLRPEWFFTIMLMTIGGRYLTFQTIYGLRIYWALGAVLALTGMLIMMFDFLTAYTAFVGGAIEVLFALIIFNLAKSSEATVGEIQA